MRKATPFLATITLTLLAFTATGAHTPTEPMTAIDAADGAVPTQGTDHNPTCTTEAIGGYIGGHPSNGGIPALGDVPVCPNLPHTGTNFIQGFFLPPGSTMTGTTISSLEHSNGERVFECTWDNGALAGCQGQGTFPSPGATPDWTCWSEFPSFGDWGCVLIH